MTTNEGDTASPTDTAVQSDGREQYTYDAFISYRTRDGRRVATWLSRQLRRYRPPRGFPRSVPSLRIYRDSERQRVISRLWDERIQPALGRSRFLIVILTPAVLDDVEGENNWVIREFTEFVRLRRGHNVLFVWAAGVSNLPFPETFREIFPEPGWIDLRPATSVWRFTWRRAVLRERVTALAAPLLEVPDEELPALNRLVEHEQRRIAWLTTAVASVLVAVMSALAAVAWWQRLEALEQARVAQSRQLAAQSNLLLVQDPGHSRLALLLALESQRRKPSAESDFAIRQALDRYRRLTRIWSAERFPDLLAAGFDGSRLIASDARGVWEIPIATQPAVRIAEDQRITAAVLSKRWTALVTATRRGVVRLRTGADRRIDATRTFDGEILRLSLSADESMVAVSTDHGVHIVELPTLKTVRTLQLSDRAAPPAAGHAWFRPDGRVVVLDYRFDLRIYAPDSSRPEATYDIQQGQQIPFGDTFAAVSRDGRLFAAGSSASRDAVALFDETGRELRRFAFDVQLRDIAISPDGRLLAVANDPVMMTAIRANPPWVRVFRIQDGAELFRLGGARAARLIFTDDSSGLCLSVEAGIECTQVAATLSWTQTELKIPTAPSMTAVSDISADGAFVATTVMGNQNAFGVGDWRPLVAYASSSYAAFSPDGRWLVTLARDAVKLVDMHAGTSSAPSSIRAPSFALLSENAARILISRQTGTSIVERSTGAIVRTFANVSGRTLSPSGRLAGYRSAPDEMTLVRVDDGKEVLRVAVPDYWSVIRIDRFDRYLAIADANGMISVRSLADPDHRLLFERDVAAAALTFSRDGEALAVASSNGVARVIALPSGLELHRIQRVEPLSAVQFTADGRSLWLAIRGARLERHILHEDDLRRVACRSVGENLTAREWADFIGGNPESTCQ